MNDQVIIEYPATGPTYTCPGEYGVYRYSTWPPGTANAGTPRRSNLGIYPSLAKAQDEHPGAEWNGPGWNGQAMIPALPVEQPPGGWDPNDTPWRNDD